MKITQEQIREMIKEAMGAMGHMSSAPMQAGAMEPRGYCSREDCCAAVMCMVECCSCPVTKAALLQCCSDIMSGRYDS